MTPSLLRPGDLVGITCPAGYVSGERVAYAVTVLQQWGYRVRLGATVGNEFHYFSGDDATRRADLQAMLDDEEVKAILMGRGGYGMSRIIDDLDFSAFCRVPKWICGFSDITVLHNHIQAISGIPTLHSPMCGAFQPGKETAYYIQSLRQALSGERLHYEFAAHPDNRPGTASGMLTGGNLVMLAHLTGSASEVPTDGRILFIEDIGEHLYNIDRMLYQLRRAGKLSRLAGLMVGSFTDLQDTERPFGQSLEEIIRDKVADNDYPLCFNVPCGHQEENITLILGAQARLEVHAAGARLQFL